MLVIRHTSRPHCQAPSIEYNKPDSLVGFQVEHSQQWSEMFRFDFFWLSYLKISHYQKNGVRQINKSERLVSQKSVQQVTRL